MRIPVRPAPEPPRLKPPTQNGSRPGFMKTSADRNPCYEPFKLSRSRSAGKLGETKKPPPRPPPPLKVVTGLKSSSSLNSTRQPTQLLYGLLGRSKTNSKVPKSQTSVALCDEKQAGSRQQPQTPCGLLIDLSSPPGSPTRSSSDGHSLNSFGSDGLNNPNSQVESGFEDDFDSLLMSNSLTPNVTDPWAIDPFTSSKQAQLTVNSVPFELSNEDPRSKHKSVSTTTAVSTKPTIIRAKNLKPARPPPPKLRPCSTPPSFVSAPLDTPTPADWSPPMPSVPPPPPPPEVLTTPHLPPRPTTLPQEGALKKKPYCIALYDYETGHPDDLSFKVNDVIHLTEKINNEWLRGTLHDKEGMFPVNFVNVIVPLEESSSENFNYKYVIALYSFTPETWDDLAFEEGDTVKVLKRLNDHWLFGECKGKQGQFPENYVTDVSAFFPLQENYS